jgi:predicted amino acid-binding ACT domain protein
MRQFATITVIGRDKIGVLTRLTAFLLWQKTPSKALARQVTRGRFQPDAASLMACKRLPCR